MSSPRSRLGLSDDEEARLGSDDATRIRTFRLLVLLAQQLRTLMDQRLRPDGLTTQQAALISVVDSLGAPSLSGAAEALGTTHQNVKQIADALARKGFMEITRDEHDRRVRRLAVTDTNRHYWDKRSPSDHEAVLEWFSALDAQEARALFELLLRLEDGVRTSLAAE